LGVIPFLYNTWVDLKVTLLAILSLSNAILLKFTIAFCTEKFYATTDYFFPSFVSHS
jgi:hypothetical protein